MSTVSDDLRTRAEQLRRALPRRQLPDPPKENGERIATLDRSDSEQIRIHWAEFGGKKFVSIRMWVKDADGQWWPDKRGIALRVREIPALADAVVELLDLAGAELRPRGQSRPPMPGRPVPGLPPAAARSAEAFDEFHQPGED